MLTIRPNGFIFGSLPTQLFLFVLSYRFTQIVADSQIKTPGGKTYDVIFVGTGKCDELEMKIKNSFKN